MHHGVLNGKEIQQGGDTCTRAADSFCCAVETNMESDMTEAT